VCTDKSCHANAQTLTVTSVVSAFAQTPAFAAPTHTETAIATRALLARISCRTQMQNNYCLLYTRSS